MTVLVTFASRHGSTRGIAESIAAELETVGHTTTFAEVSNVSSLDAFDAVVIGSGVHLGRWLPQARTFIEDHQRELSTRPVWLFSSGKIGDEGDTALPADVDKMSETINVQGHGTFGGSLDMSTLGIGERLITKAVRAKAGDYRDWDAIRDWARQIGQTLTQMRDQAEQPHPVHADLQRTADAGGRV